MIAGAVGVGLVLLYPGEFTWVYVDGGPSWAVWSRSSAASAALLFGAWRPLWGPDPGRWALAAALAFVLPVAAAGLSRVEKAQPDTFPHAWGLGRRPRRRLHRRGRLLRPDDGVQALAYAPVYVNTSAPGHVAEVHANHVFARARDTQHFFWDAEIADSEREAILQRWGADWVLVNKERSHPQQFLARFPIVYEDDRFALYDVRS